MSTSQGPADEAADLLIHYFRTLSGIDRADWDPDYSSEIRNIVDHLMEGAREVAREEVETRLREVEKKHEADIRRLWDHIYSIPGGV